MELISFRVTMYKGILDSGWVEVNPLTVLVGKNESGKTTLLKALHKLNPYTSEPYVMRKEWPRGRRREQNEEQVICQAKFQLSDQEKSDLSHITESDTFPDTVEVSRNYAGDLKIHFEGEIFSDKRHPDDIDNAFNILPQLQDEFGDPFKKCVEECIKEVEILAHEERFAELIDLTQKHDPLLRQAVSPSEPPQQIENNFINAYIAGLQQLVQELEPLPSIQAKVHEYVREHLPTFIYMDDYRVFRGTAQLDEIKSYRDSNRLTEEDETFLTILNLSGLDLDELIQLGQGSEEQVEARQYDLADGAATLTAEISDRFRQRRYEIDYRADRSFFFTFVKDERDTALIRLDERSKGFQWYFSFDLMFMHESEGTFKGCVILLDEPGLHLHPELQKDLLLRLEHYAEGNTLLYTTHLPFMIDLNHPDRIRVLKETDNGIVVTTDLVEGPPEAKFVLQAALGMDVSQSFLVAKRNLIVEGINDYWILTELSNLLQRNGLEGLPEDVRMSSAGGAPETVGLSAFMIGQNLDVVTLLDSDQEGRKAQAKLVKTWLDRYKKTQTAVILLGDAVGVKDNFALEDLFSDNFITDIVKEAYSKELEFAGVDEIALQGDGILWGRIKRFMKEKEIKINKGPIATRLRKKLSNMKDASELPPETREYAIKLFQTIRNAFGEE